MLSSSGDQTVEKVTQYGNNKGTHDENLGHTLISSSLNPNLGASYAKLFTGERSRKSVNFGTLVTPAENMADVAIPLEYIRAISKRFVNTAYDFFLGKWVAYPVFSSMDGFDQMLKNEDVVNVPVWVKLHVVPMTMFSENRLSDIATKLDTIVVAMSKLVGEGFYTCTIRVEYEWKPPRCAYCKVFIHVQDECPKNIGSDVAKNLKNPSHAPKGVPVGPKVGFKPFKHVYRDVFKKNNANTSGTKKKNVESRKEVGNSNPFDVLNLVENNVDLGTNGGTSYLASKEANSSGFAL
ncbi:hypothetical protein Tco_0218964 [Tanacetum coccineum]